MTILKRLFDIFLNFRKKSQCTHEFQARGIFASCSIDECVKIMAKICAKKHGQLSHVYLFTAIFLFAEFECFGSVFACLLFVCLFVCLLVCLFTCCRTMVDILQINDNLPIR